jgi:hypothetical protein
MKAPAITTAAIATAMIVYIISGPFDPLEPRVLARVRFLFASRWARRCCLAERRLVGGTPPPLEGRPLGRLDVIALDPRVLIDWSAGQVSSSASAASGLGVCM